MNNTTLLVIRVGVTIVWAVTPMTLVVGGFLNYQRLKSLRRYVIVANLIVAAMVTTPEVFTQVIAAAAFQVGYEITVLISGLRERQKQKRAALEV